MLNVVLLAIAGAAGTLLRHGASVLLQTTLGRGFPYGTFTVNLVGSFLIAVVAELLSERSTWNGTDLRIVVGVGLLGGFTTYSSFSLEALGMLQDRLWLKGGLYIAGTVGVCLAASLGGYWVGRALK